jgi:hypothetical protein
MPASNISSLRVAIALVGLLLVAALAFAWLGPDSGDSNRPLYDAPPEEAQWVLFVGNSHTFYNDLPHMVQRLADSDSEGAPIWSEELVRGGASLNDHLASPTLRATIERDQFDFVVIQGGSLEPVTNPDLFAQSFQEVATLAQSSGATPVLYEIWPRAETDPIYEHPTMPQSPDLFARQIYATTDDAMEGTEALLAPVARAWERSRRQGTGLSLYLEDGNHATPAGTYLAALVIYAAIRQADLTDELWHPGELSSQEAALLRELANAVEP